MQQNPYQAPYNSPPHHAPHVAQNGYGQPSAPSQGYEFTPLENSVIGSTASWTNGAGIIQAVLGGLVVLAAIAAVVGGNVGGALANGLAAAVYLTIGFALIGAASALKRVVSTQGNDVQHLMEALKAYERAFKIQVILVILALVIGLVGGFLAFVVFGR